MSVDCGEGVGLEGDIAARRAEKFRGCSVSSCRIELFSWLKVEGLLDWGGGLREGIEVLPPVTAPAYEGAAEGGLAAAGAGLVEGVAAVSAVAVVVVATVAGLVVAVLVAGQPS